MGEVPMDPRAIGENASGAPSHDDIARELSVANYGDVESDRQFTAAQQEVRANVRAREAAKASQPEDERTRMEEARRKVAALGESIWNQPK